MAGYALGFDDGGDVPEDDIDTSAGDTQFSSPAAAPPISTDNSQGQPSGPQPVPAEQQEQTPTSGLLQDAQNTPMNQGVKKIVSYLMGAGAADPDTAKKFETGIKHENPGISDDDANLLAVHKAQEMGGPAAAWAMVQYNRTAYNAKQAFAKAALNGVDGKAGDMQAAADAATKAGAHILDGSATQFTAIPGGQGVTATVKMPGTDRTVNFQLNPQQFNQWLDVGGAGMWDKVMEGGGVPTTLQKIAGSQQSAQPQASGQPQPAPAATPSAVPGPADSQAVTTGKPQVMDPTQADQAPVPGQFDAHGHYLGKEEPDKTNYDPDLVARANKMYPMAGDEAERQTWMSGQENQQEERENRVSVAAEKGKSDIEKARQTGIYRNEATRVGSENRKEGQIGAANARAGGQVESATIKAKADTDKARQQAILATTKMAQQSTDAKMRENGRMARAELTNPNKLLTSADDVNAILKKYGVAPSAPGTEQAPATGAPAVAPTQRPANVPPGAKLYQGKWYTRGPDGSAVPVQ